MHLVCYQELQVARLVYDVTSYVEAQHSGRLKVTSTLEVV